MCLPNILAYIVNISQTYVNVNTCLIGVILNSFRAMSCLTSKKKKKKTTPKIK